MDENQRKRLQFLIRSGKTPQKVALRARIILLAAEGVPNNAIAARLGTSRPTVLLWRAAFRVLGGVGDHEGCQAAREEEGDLRRAGQAGGGKDAAQHSREADALEHPLHGQGGGRSRTLRFTASGSSTGWRLTGWRRSSCRRIRSSSRSCGMWWGCIWIRPRKPWCFRWMRRARSKRWSAPGRCCRCGPGYRRNRRTTTLGMGPRRCSRR